MIIASRRCPAGSLNTRAREGVSTRTSGWALAWHSTQASAFLSTSRPASGAVENMTRPSLLKMRMRLIPGCRATTCIVS